MQIPKYSAQSLINYLYSLMISYMVIVIQFEKINLWDLCVQVSDAPTV